MADVVSDPSDGEASGPNDGLGAALSVRERDGVVVVVLGGEIDAAIAAELERAIAQRLGPVSGPVAIDLSDVTFIDSAGIELLFSLARGLLARGEELRVIAPAEAPVRRLLELCDLGCVARLAERL